MSSWYPTLSANGALRIGAPLVSDWVRKGNGKSKRGSFTAFRMTALTSPVPEGEGPGAPSCLGKMIGAGGTLGVFGRDHPYRAAPVGGVPDTVIGSECWVEGIAIPGLRIETWGTLDSC